MTAKCTFKKLTFGEEAMNQFQTTTDQIDHLQGLSCQVKKDFSNTSKRVDKITHKVSMVKL